MFSKIMTGLIGSALMLGALGGCSVRADVGTGGPIDEVNDPPILQKVAFPASCNLDSQSFCTVTVNLTFSDPDGDPVTKVIFREKGTNETITANIPSVAGTSASVTVPVTVKIGGEPGTRTYYTVTVVDSLGAASLAGEAFLDFVGNTPQPPVLEKVTFPTSCTLDANDFCNVSVGIRYYDPNGDKISKVVFTENGTNESLTVATPDAVGTTTPTDMTISVKIGGTKGTSTTYNVVLYDSTGLASKAGQAYLTYQ